MAIADMNGDRLDDIITIDRTGNMKIEYQNDGAGFNSIRFPLVLNREWSMCIADVDGNGFNDVFAGGRYNGLKILLANEDGSDYTIKGIIDPSIFLQGSNFIDFNNDGKIDIFACHDDGLSIPFQGDGFGNFFVNYTLLNPVSSTPSDNSGNYGSIWVDYDNDGDMDLYISKCREGVSNPLDGRRVNLLYRNDGVQGFTEVAGEVGLIPFGQSWATDFADIDNDGDMDCFVVNHDIVDRLYENIGNGSFVNITNTSFNIVDLTSAGDAIQVKFEDFDNDGFVDLLYTTTGSDHRLFVNNGDKTFTSLEDPFPTNGNRIHSAVTGDLNHDGFIDVYAGFGEQYNSVGEVYDKLYLNDRNENNFFRVFLEGELSNPNGIGARLELYGNWGKQIREVRSGESYGIMTSFIRHFGIGTATEIDSLIVRWPSGIVDKIVNPDINQTLVVKETEYCISKAKFTFAVDDLTVNLIDQSDGSPTNWAWEFGDLGSSNDQNPTFTFEEPGAVEVCLAIVGICGLDQSCKTIGVGCTSPAADFNFSGDNFGFQFEDRSTGTIESWHWDFGDGDTSISRNPSHTFSEIGLYNICLTTSGFCGEDIHCEEIFVNCAAPDVFFDFSIDQLTVSFEDNTLRNPTSWLWTFGDDSTSVEQNPVHTYAEDGTYTVCLEASNNCNTTQLCQEVNLTCVNDLVAEFGSEVEELMVSFSDSSSGVIDTWEWSFGDGNNSTLQSPSHTYSNPGDYTVCLTTQGGCGTDVECKSITVNCPPINMGISFEEEELSVDFMATVSIEVSEWIWDFGDETTSTESNPTHVYDMPGAYEVCVTAKTNCGDQVHCITIEAACTPPGTGFSFQANELVVFFTDFSTNSPDSWRWTFGDNTASIQQNPTHTFEAPGEYEVCLTATSICGSTQFCEVIDLSCSPPSPSFNAQSNGLQVVFTNLSTNDPTGWQWTFGDGTGSNEENPQHTYTQPGSYQVCLDASSICGNDQICQTIQITCSPPQADFSAQGNELSFFFEDNTNGSVDTWRWDFGDGSSSFLQSVQHNYLAPGIYEVCLTITNVCGSDQICQNINVNCSPPAANFGVQADELSVSFDDLTGGIVDSWNWTFGDGNASMEQNPTHTFAVPGTYQVCLQIGNTCGENTLCQMITINCSAPQADFSLQTNELNVNFNDLSSNNPSNWLWLFGDGQSSTEQNPNYTYAFPGNYTVCLQVSSPCGNTQSCQVVTVNCNPPQSDFSIQVDDLDLAFQDNSSGSPDNWNWTFGDGRSSNEQNPSHTYLFPGNYEVCLTVNNQCGTTRSCQQITVTCSPPQANFSTSFNGLNQSFTDNSSGDPTSWGWTFGDGGSSTDENPTHTYNQPGIYTVCLTVSNTCGGNTNCQQVNIVVNNIDPVGKDKEAITLFPNPTKERVFLKFRDFQTQHVQVQLLALSGRQLGNWEWQITSSGTTEVIEVNHLPSALYYLKITSDVGVWLRPFLVNQ